VSGLLLGTYALKRFIVGDQTLHDWLEARPNDQLHVTAMSLAELLAEAESLSDVAQRRLWIERLTQQIPADFGPRLHSFDLPAAKQWSAVRASLGDWPAGANPNDLSVVAVTLDDDLDYIAPRETWHEQVSGLRQHDVWTGKSYPA
jgi:predicted nucleic acid-binding protein